MNTAQIFLIIGVVIVSLGLSAGVGAPVTNAVLKHVTKGQPTQPSPAEVLRGGLWIGILERIALTACILVNYPAGIAVIVAVKGLGRFRSLDGESGVSERFLVGTLTSYLWAGGIGLGGFGLIQLIA